MNAMPVVPNVARPVVVYVCRRPGFNIRQETTEVLYWGQESSKSDRVISVTKFSLRNKTIGPSVDWEIIKEWLRICRESHSDHCQGTTGSEHLNKPARVIDVQQNCIVETPASCEYITLSYVWGAKKLRKPMQTATNKSNIYSLTEPGALSRINLQNTIIDAMYACMKINHRYLWIDSLCIIQDDKDDLAEQIACMSDIYSGASLTIIAGWSDNADSGLPGVFQGPQRDPQYIAQFEGLEIVEVLPFLGKVIKHSTWRARAWT